MSPAAASPPTTPLRRFVGGGRVDMTALATELGVNRVTLYRWVGSREQMLVEEGESAMRLLTRHETDFQPRLIAAVEAYLDPKGPDRRRARAIFARLLQNQRL